jgi:hypothetical protein
MTDAGAEQLVAAVDDEEEEDLDALWGGAL